MHRRTVLLVAAAAILTSSGPAAAHHSFAMFDRTREVKVSGTVKEVQWANPHVWLEIVVSNPAGGETQWSFEGGSTTYTLDTEDCERIFAIAIDLIEKKKKAIAQALLDTPSPALLGYDSDRTIDEVPF